MDVKKIFVVLVDISGYTNFLRMHKTSLLHAEKIIAELMESMLNEVKAPVIAHEILGDAISLYAVNDGSPGIAEGIYQQLEKYFEAFYTRESYLLRECGFCVCEACKSVGKLKLKAILHAGEAAFTKVHDIQKISGVDIITAHRLLKNSIDSDNYIFMTNSFFENFVSFDKADFIHHSEDCEGIGMVDGLVKIITASEPETTVSVWGKFKFFLKLESHMFSRLLGKRKAEFRNLSGN